MYSLPHHRKQILIRIADLEKGIVYCEQQISDPSIENWERKEYEGVVGDYKAELARLKPANADILN